MRLLILLIALASNIAYGLPCPNGGGILTKGDSIDEVIRRCGPPLEKRIVTRVVSANQEWIYYFPHAHDTGYSQMIVEFRNEHVTSIRITERYPYYFCQQGYIRIGGVNTLQTSCGDWIYQTSFTNICGWSFGIGDSTQVVESACGRPMSQANLQNETYEVTELTYGGLRPQTIVFQDGKLTDWK